MANMIQLPDGKVEAIFGGRDFLDLLENYMGAEARRWLEDWLGENDDVSDYIDDLEKEIDGLKEYHRSVMKSIRKHSEKLGKLICEKELDRRKISNTVGAIGVITWREMNR